MLLVFIAFGNIKFVLLLAILVHKDRRGRGRRRKKGCVY
jgi:hypothetical protein